MRPLRKKPTSMIVIHCSATPPSRDIGVGDIDTMHKARGWQGVGYHVVIKRNGAVQLGEPIQNRGAHAKGVNNISVGVCLVGGIAEDGSSEMNFEQVQFDALQDVLRFLELVYPNAEVLGHRDLSPDLNGDGEVNQHEWVKDCPCFDVKRFVVTGEAVFVGTEEPSQEPEIKGWDDIDDSPDEYVEEDEEEELDEDL